MDFFFVLWRGIHDPGQTQEKNGERGFNLLQPQPAVLPRSDAGSDGVEPASCFVIQNCQTHIISQGARCTRHVNIMWSAVCSLAPHSHFAEEAKLHLCMDEPKRPTPRNRQLNLTQGVLVKLILIGLVLTLEM